MAIPHAQISWMLQQGFFTAALRDIAALQSGGVKTAELSLLMALALKGRGEIQEARKHFAQLLDEPNPIGEEAFFAFIETEMLLGKWEYANELLEKRPQLQNCHRGKLFCSRVLARKSPNEGLERLLALSMDHDCPDAIRRLAGFEATRILDHAGRYKESLECANRFHRSFTGQDVTKELLQHLDLQLDAIHSGALPGKSAGKIEKTAFIVGLPRSGTSLLEQMLDSHPEINAIGEFDGLKEIIHTMTSQNVSPYQLLSLDWNSVNALRQIYQDGARKFVPEGFHWVLDKNLLTWSSLPFLAELLPGARYLCIQRDPRDVAVSILLSWFDYEHYPWVTRMSDLFDVLFRAHTLLPRCLYHCGLEFEELKYEELVDNPRPTIQKCMRLLELEFDARILAPEQNPRPVNTLSFEQVMEPIHRKSIGRWKNYEWLFDSDWHRLAEAVGY